MYYGKNMVLKYFQDQISLIIYTLSPLYVMLFTDERKMAVFESLSWDAHNNKGSHYEEQRTARNIISVVLGGESRRRRIDYPARLCANETAVAQRTIEDEDRFSPGRKEGVEVLFVELLSTFQG